MGRAHFLFCLPARLGVLIFSLGNFASTGLLATILWITLVHYQQNHDDQLSKPMLAGVIALAVFSTITALTSLAGFFGALFGRLGGVRAFAKTLAFLLGMQFVFSVLYVVAIFVEPKSEFIKQCEAGKTDSNIVDVCTNKINEVRIITIVIVIVGLLLHAYEVHVVRGYAVQLEQKEVNRNIILGHSNAHGRYSAVPHGEDSKPLTGPNMSYPYTDAAHGHGHHGGSYA